MPPPDKSVHIAQIFVPEIKELLTAKNFAALKSLLRSLSMIDVADVWNEFGREERTLLFRLLTHRDAITIFQELEPEEQSELLASLENPELEGLIGDMRPEKAAKLFSKLPDRTVKYLSRFLEKDSKRSVEELMTYPEKTVGNWMHIQRVELRPTMTSSQALERIRVVARLRTGGGPDGYYVTDKNNRVSGFVSLRELIAAPPKTKLSDYMSSVRQLRLYPEQDQEEAISLFTRYKLSMAPVVDVEDNLLGYIQAEDIIPLAQQESTEDIQKLGGTEALDEPYFKIAFPSMIKKRGTWLCVLFFGEMLTATAMGFFEGELEKAIVLALFIPLIISSGGNSGSQAASLIVRALALKEVGFHDWWRVMRREFASGLALGSLLGVLGFLRIFLWSQFSTVYGPHYVGVALTVGVALILIVLLGSLSGSLLPLLLRRMGFDPAVASAPFVATLVDVTGLIIYFLTASIFLSGTLL